MLTSNYGRSSRPTGNKNKVGDTQTVLITRQEGGGYPVVFDFVYVDQNTMSKVPVSDSTHFELIHKIPEEVLKQLYPPRRPDAPCKPLRPRPL